MIHKQNLIILLSLVSFFSLSQAQSKTNFEMIDSLIHRSVNELVSNINNDIQYKLVFNSADAYSILKSKVTFYLQQKGMKLNESAVSREEINYTLDEARILYSEVFRDGLFGDFMVKRSAEINGSYFIKNTSYISESNKFIYVIEDSVLYSDIFKLENIAYSFTSSEIPEEPFFSSALEPAIAIGTAAVAVYLFFNIRSK